MKTKKLIFTVSIFPARLRFTLLMADWLTTNYLLPVRFLFLILLMAGGPVFSFAQFNLLWTQTSNPSAGNDWISSITSGASGIYVTGRSNTPWRIEKRDLNTGALITTFGTAGVVTSTGGNIAYAITSDASGIYVAGRNTTSSSNWQWRIEKRDLTTGALITTFGTAGVILSDPSAGYDLAYAITVDAGGIYVAGYEWISGIDFQWRIEKRDLNTGALIAAFGTTGVVTSNPSVDPDEIRAIAADAGGIYVAGYDNGPGNMQWRIEKRDLTTGALITTFGTAGVITNNPSAGFNQAYAIIADAGGIYVAGYDESQSNWQWRIEKRDLSTGALIAAFGTAGVVTSNPSPFGEYVNAITADAGGIYVAGNDNTPGNMQWRIEKYNKMTGALLCTRISNPSVKDDVAYAITSDASGIYVAGYEYNSGTWQWRIEKYDLCGAILAVTVTPTNNLCYGECIGTAVATPTNGTSPYTYNWSNAQTTQIITGLCAGTYTVTVTDSAATITTATVAIAQPTVLTVTATSTPSACGSNGSATATAGGGTPGYTYSWNNSQTSQTAAGLTVGNYTATITDANGCTATQTVGVVSSGSVITTNQSASLCTGSTYTLPGGTVVSTGGIYNDTLTSVGGCDSIITTNLIVNPKPVAVVFSNPPAAGQMVTITQGQSVTLTASGGGSYSWSPATGLSCTTCANPVATAPPPLGAGGLIYCVTVTDANNCTDTACVTITIEPIDCSIARSLYLPNAFSPNDDGENDKLQIYYGDLKCIKTFKLVIYNRWGEKVFTTNDPDFLWDGTDYLGIFERTDLGTAVFVFYMQATLISEEEIIKKGNISLIQ